MEYNEMIDTLVNEVLKRLNNPPKTALVLFTGLSENLDEIVNEVNKLKDDGWNLNVILPKSLQQGISEDERFSKLNADQLYKENQNIDEEKLLKGIEVLVIPILTIDTLAKVSLGIADTTATKLLAKGIMMGTPMVSAKDACDIENFEKFNVRYSKIPKAYVKKFKGYMEDLQEYGVKFVDSKSLYKTLSNNVESKNQSEFFISKKIISAEDVILAHGKGVKIVKIEGTTIVTLLAKDTARELGVEIQCI
ncbi:MAG: flavoprotein [Clostridiaceae bacterium]